MILYYNSTRALYATVETPSGPRTFRVGLPASDRVIRARHQRFDNAHYRNRRRLTITLRNGASYPVRWLEIRDVDAQGRGLGAERHFTAYGVPVSALTIERDRPHTVALYGSKRWSATQQQSAMVATPTGHYAVGYGADVQAAVLDAKRTARQRQII